MRLKKTTCFAVFLFIGTLCNAAEAKLSALPRSTPEQQGIASAAMLDFVQTADRQMDAMHSFMLVRHGNVVADGVYNAKLAFYETPFCVTITLKFSADKLLYDAEYNVVRRGSKEQPQLVGHAE